MDVFVSDSRLNCHLQDVIQTVIRTEMQSLQKYRVFNLKYKGKRKSSPSAILSEKPVVDL